MSELQPARAPGVLGDLGSSLLERAYSLYFAELTRRLGRRIYCKETANDIAQSAFIKLAAHKNLESLEDAKALVFKIARDLSIDHMRKEATHRRIHEENGGSFAVNGCDPATPEDNAIENDLYRQLLDVVSRLPKKRREALLLARFQGRNLSEIAAALNISEESARRHIYQGLRDCRIAMEAALGPPPGEPARPPEKRAKLNGYNEHSTPFKHR